MSVDRPTLGERMRTLIGTAGAATALDDGTRRLASALDPTDTDAGLEAVQTELTDAFVTAATSLAVRRGWNLP